MAKKEENQVNIYPEEYMFKTIKLYKASSVF